MAKIVLLDIDSTLNNFQEHFLNVFSQKYPDLYSKLPESASHYDALKLNRDFSMKILQEDGFNEKMVPLEGAPEAVEELDRRGYLIYFCTALVTDHSNTMRDRVEWIGKWFGEKWMERVIFTKDKTMVRGDFLIDDSPFKTRGNLNPTWKLIVFDVSYNREDECYGRIFGWKNTKPLFDLLESE